MKFGILDAGFSRNSLQPAQEVSVGFADAI
jgi:hypothetical protein